MNKTEFITALKNYLYGKIPQGDIDSHVDYYSAYIDGEISRGRSESEVLEELGNPRIIAKNLVLTADISGGTGSSKGEYYSQPNEDNNAGSYSGGNAYSSQGTSQGQSHDSKDSGSGWGRVKKALIIAVVIAVVVLLIITVGRIGFALIRIFLPIIIIVLLGSLFFGTYRRR